MSELMRPVCNLEVAFHHTLFCYANNFSQCGIFEMCPPPPPPPTMRAHMWSPLFISCEQDQLGDLVDKASASTAV